MHGKETVSEMLVYRSSEKINLSTKLRSEFELESISLEHYMTCARHAT